MYYVAGLIDHGGGDTVKPVTLTTVLLPTLASVSTCLPIVMETVPVMVAMLEQRLTGNHSDERERGVMLLEWLCQSDGYNIFEKSLRIH